MFGKRTVSEPAFGKPAREAAGAPPRISPEPAVPGVAPAAAKPATQVAPQASKPAPRVLTDSRSDDYYQIKSTIFNALIDTIDLAQLAQLDPDSAREEIRDIVNEIISIKAVVMSIAEQEALLQDICNDVLGYGPLEPLLARDDISDIMVNGSQSCYIEVGGRVKVGVDVTVRPVIEIDGRNAERGVLVDLVIAAQLERRVLGPQRLLASLRRRQRVLGRAGGRVQISLAVGPGGERPGDVVHE